MQNELQKLKQQILTELQNIRNSEGLRELEVKFLGRKGEFTKILKSIKDLDDEDKKKIGKLANEVKLELVEKFREVKEVVEGTDDNAMIDVGVPGRKLEQGHLSPITQIQYELEDIFKSMGFMVLDGPELESDYYNFEGLNIPDHHPARDMQDTFYVGEPHPIDMAQGRPDPFLKKEKEASKLVLRTHTSPVQVRAMQEYGAPLRCVVPGRVFRNEATDATHDTTFDQIEGLMVGEDISLSNLISVLKEMLNAVFKSEVKIRVRPGYFPFVEPGIEMDMACTICSGAKCPACKHTGWLEMIGAGMVHPNVLKHGHIDPDKYSGFAFGMGTTRLAMMRYGISDIRLFNGGDLRFVRQF